VGDPDERIQKLHDYSTQRFEIASDLMAGRYNLSHVSRWEGTNLDGAGSAVVENSDMYLPGEDRVHHITVMPVVSAVNPAQSGSGGGHEVTVTVSGHNPVNCSENRVSLAGRPCHVLSCNDTSITCRASAANASLVPLESRFQRGLRLRRWYLDRSRGSLAHYEANIEPLPEDDLEIALGGITIPRNFGSRYTTALDGYFVPPLTTNYSFFVVVRP
jgi:hypothetical protein